MEKESIIKAMNKYFDKKTLEKELDKETFDNKAEEKDDNDDDNDDNDDDDIDNDDDDENDDDDIDDDDNDNNDNDDDDDDDDDEEYRKVNVVKNTTIYRKFYTYWKLFKNKCKENNILVKSEYTCCDTCGNYEIREERAEQETKNKKYYAYIFYHVQEANRIYDQCEKEKKEILVNLGWGYFENKNEDGDKGCINLAKKIYEYAVSVGCDLEYTNIFSKLILKVKID